MKILDKAIEFAVQAHSGMTRKGTQIPYILHPMETAAIVSTMSDDIEIIAAAVLHDVLEDTDITLGDLKEHFGERIAKLVASESENKREDRPASETWRIRKEETIVHLRTTQDIAEKIITLGDKLSNMRAIDRDEIVLGDKLWERFNQKDKSQHYWYYASIAEATNELCNYPAWKEYDALVCKVFS